MRLTGDIAEVWTTSLLVFALLAAFGSNGADAQKASAPQQDRISIRTENYSRPPYSGATYYIYERGGEVICTKLRVCNKLNNCSTEYKKGKYKDEIDIEAGDPFGQTEPVFIRPSKLRKHVCLTRFKLTSK